MRYLLCGASGALGSLFQEKLEKMGVVDTMSLMEYDFTTIESIAMALGHIRNRKPYDALLWNCGTTSIGTLENSREAGWPEFENILRCNVTAAYAVAREAFLRMQAVNGPEPFIGVFISSEAARQALRNSHGYCASKAALESVVRSLARETARFNGRFYGVAPGPVKGTGMNDMAFKFLRTETKLTDDDARKYLNNNPLNRACTIDEVWEVVKFALEAPQAASGSVFRLPLAQGNA